MCGPGGGYPQIKQKSKKNPPPKKLGVPLNPPNPPKLKTPRKIGDPPKNWRPPRTRLPPPCGQNDTRLWKYYLGQNFVSAGNYNLMQGTWIRSLIWLETASFHWSINIKSIYKKAAFSVSEQLAARIHWWYLLSLWIWRSCMKQSRRMKIVLSGNQIMMMSQEVFNKYSSCWEGSPHKYCFLIGAYHWCHHFMLPGPEVFTSIFLQFLPKTRIAKYHHWLHNFIIDGDNFCSPETGIWC